MSYKITLIHCADPIIAKTQMFGVNYMPIWAYTLSSYIKSIKDITVELFDNRIESESDVKESDVFLFTGINQDYNAIIALHENLKSRFPKSKFIIGGPICWSFSVAGKISDLNMFDHIVIGDGENSITEITKKLKNNEKLEKIIDNKEKFQLSNSIPMDTELLDKTYDRYYGGIIEVSRGCPFLCEFCDIRIQLDNNRAHNKSIDVILKELDYFTSKGVNQILFACDNFIGDPKWAEDVCDAIIKWKKDTGNTVSLYTWLTINVGNLDRLLKKLRLAGFDMFFIGVESFGTNQLLETAKIQNVKTTMIETIKTIQSYGFIVVAGLIFGFDSDPDDVVYVTLDGIKESGLISGDPSLLTALPGTPLYKRMKYSNRLRDGKLGLGGFKYRTNIKYLKKEESIIYDFKLFVDEYNKGKYQLDRLTNFYKTIIYSDNFVKVEEANYISVSKLFKIVLKNYMALFSVIKRFAKLFLSFDRMIYITKSIVRTVSFNKKYKINFWPYFKFWLFNWSNSIVKYSNVKPEDYDIGYVGDDFNYEDLVPDEYLSERDEPIPATKIDSQRKLTVKALSNLKKAN